MSSPTPESISVGKVIAIDRNFIARFLVSSTFVLVSCDIHVRRRLIQIHRTLVSGEAVKALTGTFREEYSFITQINVVLFTLITII